MQGKQFPKSFSCYRPYNHKVYGSICISPLNTILMVKGKKTGKWSFPKGHRNRSESYLECAIRETREETGLDLFDRRPVAYHRLSVGEYFFFEVEEEFEAVVEDTQEVSEARWVALDEIQHLECNVDVNNFLDRLDRHMRRPSFNFTHSKPDLFERVPQ